MCSDTVEVLDRLNWYVDLIKDDLGKLKERLRVGAPIARYSRTEGISVPEVHVDGADVRHELLRLEFKLREVFHLQNLLLLQPNLGARESGEPLIRRNTCTIFFLMQL